MQRIQQESVEMYVKSLNHHRANEKRHENTPKENDVVSRAVEVHGSSGVLAYRKIANIHRTVQVDERLGRDSCWLRAGRNET